MSKTAISDAPRISVAIPVHNEESVLPELLRRTKSALDAIPGGPHEIVIVDDGSSDRTLDLLEQAAQEDPRLLIVSFSRNFGHQAAISAALDRVAGDVTVVMDGDLQDPPEAIPLFLAQYSQGYDVVYARRVRRKEAWWLRLCYFLFYRLMATLSNVAVPLDAGDFGLMSRRVVEHLRKMPEHERFLRGLRTWIGFRQIGIPVERSERHSGKSKYSAMKLLKLAGDGIFAFSTVPLRLAALLGFLAIAASTVFALFSIFVKIFLQRSPQGFTSLITVVTFLSGCQLLFLGVIGEYLGRIYEEIKARPLYVVARIIGHGAQTVPSSPSSRAESMGGGH